MTRISPLQLFLVLVLIVVITLLAFAPEQLKWIDNTAFHRQPGFWSVLSLAGMLVFSGLALVISLSAGRSTPDQRGARKTGHVLQHVLPVEYAVYFLAYVALVPLLGYLIATLVVFPLLACRAGYCDRRSLVQSVVIGTVIVVLFKTLLQVKIPGGALYNLFPDSLRNFMILNF